ncbi:hypothetical protein [Spirillospora sp. NPDC048824]|uniref:hypothetical protein n=1 Tax=Spirillospora sp. NPDC048824 TaxID=3364526 RepID=UPI003723B689
MDSDEFRRGGGPRRAPVSRQGRRQPAPRRTAPGREGGPRRPNPSQARRKGAPRPGRPVPPPRMPFEDDESAYPDASPFHDTSAYPAAPAYHDAPGTGPRPLPGDAHGPGGKPGRRGGKPRQRGKPGKGGRSAGQARQSRPASREGGRGARLYFGAAAVLGLLVLLGVGAVVVPRGGGNGPAAGGAATVTIGTPAETGVSPDSYSSSSSSSAYSGIASRRADPKPLTVEEAFPSSAAKLSVPGGEVRVKLRVKRLDGDCAAAVWGATVGEVLGEGGCTQAARGIYSDTENGHALAVAVFNLAGSAEADRFVATLEQTIGAGFVRPLEAPAPLDGFGRGFDMARGLAMGHFAVVTWAQRLDGKGGPEDEALLSLLIEGGKNPAVLGRAARASE